ncbi:DUF1488 family protein [Shewanella donghaensis]|uniref:DUF1488 domain-containing protein n=1 Tax=Shewanella donghaensis TaxID=238836 RepID=UPI001183C5D9|nr:DUF1488 domain-containing protein [Shewanella donghaensis]
MNQSVIFTDLVEWDELQQTVIFIAQVQGMNVNCIIPIAKLLEKTQDKASDVVQMQQEHVLALFERVRFDFEDLAEELIEAEEFDEQGNILL